MSKQSLSTFVEAIRKSAWDSEIIAVAEVGSKRLVSFEPSSEWRNAQLEQALGFITVRRSEHPELHWVEIWRNFNEAT